MTFEINVPIDLVSDQGPLLWFIWGLLTGLHMVYKKAREISGISFIRTPIPVRGGSTSRVQFPNYHHFGH